MVKLVTVRFTPEEAAQVRLCLQGEIENDDGHTDWYFKPLVSARTKIVAAIERSRKKNLTDLTQMSEDLEGGYH